MSEQTKHTLGPWKRAPIHGCMVYAGEQLIADTWHERKTAEERDRDLADAWLMTCWRRTGDRPPRMAAYP